MREQNNTTSYPYRIICSFFLIFLLMSARGFSQNANSSEKKEITNTIYFTANTGLDTRGISTKILNTINKESQKDRNASVVVVGNFTEEQGYPSKGKERKEEEDFLKNNLLNPLKGFNGDIIFTPGTNEWNKGGQDNIDDMESFLQDNSKSEFWPNDGCPLEHKSLGDNVELIMVNSEWYLQDWDKRPEFNNKCDIKTRDQFFLEFQDDVKDAQGKTVIVAVYHPVLTDTKPGFLNRIDGTPQESYYSVQQREFHNRLETIGREFDDVIFVSSDRNLQYLDHHGVPQIISGAAAATQPAKVHKKEHFASDKNGYAKLEVFKDNSSRVYFYQVEENGTQNLLFTKDIPRQRTRLNEISYPDKSTFGKIQTASIYSEKETDKSGFYKWLWGDHYRNIYSRKIEAPVLFLDSLPGNIQPAAEGGGHQSVTLHLYNDKGEEFTLRALRKSALSYLQYSIPDHYVKDFLVNTWAERVVQDYYTTAHPYAPYASFDLMDDLGLYNTSPKVYYVPKQKRLGIFNDDYGDALYMFEEHAGDENKNSDLFGKPDDILSTADLLEDLNKSKEPYVDQNEYIKARLFDMLIGDWDRHYDQWRWAEFKQPDGRKKYEPIPRDRDQAFPKYDGVLISIIKLAIPSLRIMQSYGPELDNIKWLNMEPYPLDKKLITTANWEDWKKQVDTIQSVLTNEKIDAAFANLPKDMQDESIEKIKASLKQRRGNLLKIARRYYDFLNDHQIITGTEKDDKFNITRKDKGITQVEIFRKDSLVFKNSYDADDTQEIWIYGLDGDDTFHIDGKGDHLINLKILGGEEHDVYDFENTRNAKLYDYKSKKSTIVNPASHKWLVDSYDINTYDYTKPKYNQNAIFPLGGFSSDSGIHLGIA
ncbi:MAG: metallophosphatase, partial [Gillisia sp.]